MIHHVFRVFFVLALAIFAASPSLSHELRPAIADVSVTEDRATIRLEVNIEAFLADIDQARYQNSNDAPSDQAAEYDRFRALSDDALGAAFEQDAARFIDQLTLVSGESDVDLIVESVTVTPQSDLELPRDAQVIVSGALPAGSENIQFGWRAERGPIIVRQMDVAEDEAYTGILTDGTLSDPISLSQGSVQSGWAVFWDYVIIGFEHIVPKGLDHILFVLGLFFLSLKWKPLLFQVTAFTLAHTVTLALATLGIVSVPAAIVEPLIALSIVYVAVENIFARGINPWRTWVVFGFGLLHGLGFASVLGDVGLNPTTLIPSLIGFNVGVELGQLAVIAVAFLVVGLWFGRKDWYKPAIANPASVAIACVGAFWFVERVFL